MIIVLLFLLLAGMLLPGCSGQDYYLDIHHKERVSSAEPLDIDIFITNCRNDKKIKVESIWLVDELCASSELWKNREGIYFRNPDNNFIEALPWRELGYYETASFPMTLRLLKNGIIRGKFTIYIDGVAVDRYIQIAAD